MTDEVARIAGEIVVAFLNKASLEPDQLPELVRKVRQALEGEDASSLLALATPAAASEPGPEETAPKIEDTVFEDHLICLEDGRAFRSLKRHLREKYGLSPEAYRAKWGLPDDYPMVAPALANRRADLARAAGLGRSTSRAARRAG